MSYCFRYRAMMCTPPNAETGQSIVLTFPGSLPVEATVQGDAFPIGKWVIFKGCGFDTEEVALREGRKFGDALSVAGAIGKLGIDVGFSRSTLQFSVQVHDAERHQSGRELRAEVHGLMTFEKDTLRIVGMDARGSATINREGFQERLAPWIAYQRPLNERERNCAALLNDSFFVSNTEGQFVLRISAIESLCDQSDVGVEYQSAIQNLEDHLATLSIEAGTRSTVARWLKNARRKSLRQSYMAKFRTLLTQKDANAFDDLYDKRGKLLHDGLGRGELSEASAETLQLGVALLEAELRI